MTGPRFPLVWRVSPATADAAGTPAVGARPAVGVPPSTSDASAAPRADGAASPHARMPGLEPAARPGAPGLGPWAGLNWAPPASYADAIVPLTVPRATPTRAPALPARAAVGAQTIERYVDPRVVARDITVTVFLPLTPGGQGGVLHDMNEKPFEATFPPRFVVGDGSLRRVFVGVDKRPGTPLDTWLDALVAELPRRADGAIDLDATVEHLRTRLGTLMKGTERADGAAELLWDQAIGPQLVSTAAAMATAGGAAIGAPVTAEGAEHPVLPLERYLEAGVGYCLQKALVAGLVLERAGVPARVVQGANEVAPGVTSGHTWVELPPSPGYPQGRVLDPTWELVRTRGPDHPVIAGRWLFDQTYRFRNALYPYLELTDAAP
jgi:hypothetical protein